MPALLVRDIFKIQMFSNAHRNQFVAVAGFRIAVANGTAVDFSTDDRDIFQIFTPHQRVVKMAVAAVLIFAERIWLGRFKRAGQTEDDRGGVEQQTHVALEMNRAGRISARRKKRRTLRLATRTAVRIAFLDGLVDGGTS